MLFYQALIMAVVVLAVYILANFLKLSNRKLLVILIIGFIVVGGIGLYAVQYYFGNHYYTQEIKTDTLEGISLSSSQKKNVRSIFNNYKSVNGSAKSADGIGRTYQVKANGASSTISANIYIFSNTNDADNYFDASQRFYENKDYIPLDTMKSKRKGGGERYLISFIKSQYKDYTDFIYLPSKISYTSDILIENSNVIIVISEVSNKPVTNKSVVIDDIKHKLGLPADN